MAHIKITDKGLDVKGTGAELIALLAAAIDHIAKNADTEYTEVISMLDDALRMNALSEAGMTEEDIMEVIK